MLESTCFGAEWRKERLQLGTHARLRGLIDGKGFVVGGGVAGCEGGKQLIGGEDQEDQELGRQ